MTITQLEYMVSVDTHRHFMLAAKKCFITQPTLSMQIQKLEKELGVKIFDRTKQPVIPTEIGVVIIAQARVILLEANMIKQIINDQKNIMTGEIRIGIIPTLAPYLLPTLFKQMREKYPQVDLMIKETITEEIIQELKSNRLDCGLVVTPLKDPSIKEDVLFYEELFVYVSRKNVLYDKKYVLANEIDPDQLWLLEEGHCFRSQIINLCELRKASRTAGHFDYEAGSIETLRRMVDMNDGITILPELATLGMSNKQLAQVRYFKRPAPMREVSIVVHRDFVKKKLIEIIRQEIIAAVPSNINKNKSKYVVPV